MVDSRRFSEGDEAYFREVVIEYGPLVRDIAEQYARDDREREELFHDIWTRAWRRRGTYYGGSFKSWLYSIGLNLRRDRHRRSGAYRRLLKTLHLFEPPEPPRSALGALVEEERREAVRAVVARLPDRQRDAVLLRLDGLDYDQCAEAMGVRPATVRSLASKGLARITDDLRRIHDMS